METPTTHGGHASRAGGTGQRRVPLVHAAWVAARHRADPGHLEEAVRPPTEPGSAPPRPRVAPGPHETELPESARRRLGALEPRGEPYHVPTPIWLTALRIVAVALYVALAAAWQFTNDVVHACLLMSGFLAAIVLALKLVPEGLSVRYSSARPPNRRDRFW